MEVKVNESIRAVSAQPQESSKRQGLQRALSSLSAEKVNITRADVVSIASESKGSGSTQERSRVNEIISSLNLVSAATDEIGKLVESVAGIAEQAASDSIEEGRIGVLEQEARQLVGEIQKRTELEVPEGTKPFSGDPIRFEVERVLDETLEVILPEVASDAFGLSGISLSPKESIIRTRVSVEEARVRLDELREAVRQNQDKIGRVLNQLDVAAQNAEAAESTVRSVERALELGNSIRTAVESDPVAALRATNLREDSVELL